MVAKFRAPGMYRAFLYTLYGVAISYVIIRIFREWYDLEPLYKGEQVSQLRFRSQAERGVRAQLTGNLRAFQVPGTEHQLLAGTLQEGDRVDVVATINYKFVNFGSVPQGTSNEELTASRVVLRDLLVLRPPKQESTGTKIADGANQGNLSALLAQANRQMSPVRSTSASSAHAGSSST